MLIQFQLEVFVTSSTLLLKMFFLQNVTKRLFSWAMVGCVCLCVMIYEKTLCPSSSQTTTTTVVMMMMTVKWSKSKTKQPVLFFSTLQCCHHSCWRLIGGNCTHVTHCPLHNGISSFVLCPPLIVALFCWLIWLWLLAVGWQTQPQQQ